MSTETRPHARLHVRIVISRKQGPADYGIRQHWDTFFELSIVAVSPRSTTGILATSSLYNNTLPAC